MAAATATRNRRPRSTRVRMRSAGKPRPSASLLALSAATEPKPVRGIKLKTVSLFTMLFGLLCLGAFLAGRPPLLARLNGDAAGVSSRPVLKMKKLNVHSRADKKVRLTAATASYGTRYGMTMRGGS